jgi:uncharacterized protein with HEPN domain/predicted nucleotidyltransferase
MRPSAALAAHRDAIDAIVAKHKARNPRVFGSVARGDDREDSDLDLLVDPEPGMDLFDLARIINELESLLGIPVDVLMGDNLSEKFAARLHRGVTERERLYDYLTHIIEAIEKIQLYTKDMDSAAFAANGLVQDAVARNMEIVGEAGQKITKRFPAFLAAHPQLELADAYKTRNILAHDYDRVDFDKIWEILTGNLPKLLAEAKKIRDSLPEN